MKKHFKILSLICAVVLITGILTSCSSAKTQSTAVKPENFRVTDIIIFGNADYDENGAVTLRDDFSQSLELVRRFAATQRIYLNILGPSSQSDSDDWNDQMHDLADRNTKAFESG